MDANEYDVCLTDGRKVHVLTVLPKAETVGLLESATDGALEPVLWNEDWSATLWEPCAASVGTVFVTYGFIQADMYVIDVFDQGTYDGLWHEAIAFHGCR